jgi:peptide/nickel transport system permease protein
MVGYIVRRLILGFIVLILVSILVFLLMRLLPSDPLELYIANNQITNVTPEQLDALRVKFGLDKSYPEQYWSWISDIAHGDFGTSLYYNASVGSLLKERIPISLYLGFLSIVLSSILGIGAGLLCAIRRGTKIDTIVTSFANLGISIPIFWLSILMIYVFGVSLHWLPVQGFTSPFTDFGKSMRQIIMPVICEAMVALSINTRQARSSVLEVVRQDYIRTAWSKGLKERVIILRHVLKNSLIPVVTVIGIQASMIIGGAIFVETVFNIPGMGRLLVTAVLAEDYPVVQGITLIVAAMIVLVNIFIDVLYGWLDPRIRYG